MDESGMTDLPKLYRELAEWWPVLSSPDDYAEEAEFYRRAIVSAGGVGPRTLLELGSGGGNTASHLKQHFQMTLVDLSPEMLAVSRKRNPECEHLQGDMRTVRLGRQFDAVFIHDAIVYMTSEEDLSRTIKTAYNHCRPGGVALFAPDHTMENFGPYTKHGGHDRGGRSMRYLEWTWDPDPGDTTYLSIMVYVMREDGEEVRCVQDRHVCGLFSHDDWLRIIRDAGFEPLAIPFEHSEISTGTSEVFLGRRT
jgi:ubiquinone/menaquinone biosynthesis C-methylase UbiE